MTKCTAVELPLTATALQFATILRPLESHPTCGWDRSDATVHWGPACYEPHGECCTSVCDGFVDSCGECLTHNACEWCNPQHHHYAQATGTAGEICGSSGCAPGDCQDHAPYYVHRSYSQQESLPDSLSTPAESHGTPHRHVSDTPISNASFGPSTPVNAQAPQTFVCQWGNCGMQVSSSEALIAHVNAVHLPTSQVGTMAHELLHSNNIQHECASNPTLSWNDCLALLSNDNNVPYTSLECPWGDCSHEPGAFHNYGVPDLLQHLLSAHLEIPQHLATGTNSSRLPAAEEKAQQSPPLKSEEDCPCEPCEGKRQHPCGWMGCSESFDTHLELSNHITDVHVGSGKTEYVCGWKGCARAAEGRAFGQKQKLLRHIQTHTGYRPYVCTVCSKRFSEPSTLAQHMRTHTQERPYKCDFPGCNKSFSVMGSLTIHKRIHTGARPFKCPYPGCSRSFCESSNLHKHLRVHRVWIIILSS
ncbi:zinc-finger protein [Malassezia cuniculi]|uniref:Zinc-finger protein n=1 Tax=Malassezia cuniculi TaxID=948313 RepID=A0AAF0J9V3_9BASI|nr:zinc-finger protein [Malassezia cuniculi]